MKVQVHRVPADGEVIDTTSPLPEAHMEDVGVWVNQPVHLRLRLRVVNKRFVAIGSYETVLEMECHRCLKRYEFPVASQEYIWEQPVRLSGDETIDLTEGIQEDIMLRLPLKNLCSEDCRGLCPQCGRNLNEGPCGCRPAPSSGTFDELDTLIQDQGEAP